MPKGWQWSFDDKVPTNRDMANILDYGKTAVSLVDYYLVSPNVKVIKVEGQNLKFENSDHNPVLMEVVLEGLIETKIDSVIVDSLPIKKTTNNE